MPVWISALHFTLLLALFIGLSIWSRFRRLGSPWFNVACWCAIMATIMNGTAVLSNGGKMPAYLPASILPFVTVDSRHTLATASTHFAFLCDRFYFVRWNVCASLGDMMVVCMFLCLSLGVGNLIYKQITKEE